MRKMIAFDSETLGLQPGSRIVELGAVLFDETGILSRFESLINPEMPIPPDVLAIHGITDEMVKDAPDAGVVLENFLKWADTDHLVAHNAPYDVGIVSWAAGQHGIVLPPMKVIDTAEIAKSIKLTKNNKLATLVEFHGIQVAGEAHRAMRDAEACAKYLLINAESLTERFIRPWQADYEYTADIPLNLAMLPECVASGKPMTFTYKDDAGKTTERTIIPYGWAMQGVFMFHGYCHLREERRSFRADRVVNVEAVAA